MLIVINKFWIFSFQLKWNRPFHRLIEWPVNLVKILRSWMMSSCLTDSDTDWPESGSRAVGKINHLLIQVYSKPITQAALQLLFRNWYLALFSHPLISIRWMQDHEDASVYCMIGSVSIHPSVRRHTAHTETNSACTAWQLKHSTHTFWK